MVAILAGALVVTLFILPESMRNYFKYKKLQRENANLTEELRKQKELTLFAKKTGPTEGDISKIEHGAIEQI
jgi:hypothetical protein